ncbi:MAG: hypothetical protein LBJ00_17330 [Planctomycetaceae bacterium]|jgi:hypothetical protein|nr:hypothetical protein [Planctomycetaceae bacterium]
MKFLLLLNYEIVILRESSCWSHFMANYHLSSQQISSLKALHRTLRDRKEADRVKVVVLLGSGWSVSHVAEILLLDVNTVRSYFDKYVHGGEEELLEFNDVVRQPMLTVKQEKVLLRQLMQRYILTFQKWVRKVSQKF